MFARLKGYDILLCSKLEKNVQRVTNLQINVHLGYEGQNKFEGG